MIRNLKPLTNAVKKQNVKKFKINFFMKNFLIIYYNVLANSLNNLVF